MKKLFKGLLTFTTVCSMLGCNRELSSERLQKNMEKNFDATAEYLKEVFDGDKLGIELSADLNMKTLLTSGAETISSEMNYDIDMKANADLKSMKEFLKEVKMKEAIDSDLGYYSYLDYDEEEVESILEDDKSVIYGKINYDTKAAFGKNNSHKYSANEEVWSYPTTAYYITEDLYGIDYDVNSVEIEELYEMYSTILGIKDSINMDAEDLEDQMDKETYAIYSAFKGLLEDPDDFSSEEVVDLIEDFLGEEFTRDQGKFIESLVEDIREINFEQIYEAKNTKKDGITTYTISLKLEGIVKVLESLVNSLEKNIKEYSSSLEISSESLSQFNQLIAIFEKDLKDNMPTTFNVGVSFSFNKDNILVGVAETFEVAADTIPEILKLLAEIEVDKYDIKVNSNAEFEISSSYVKIPELDVNLTL